MQARARDLWNLPEHVHQVLPWPATFVQLPTQQYPVNMVLGEGRQPRSDDYLPALCAHFLVETTTVLHAFRLLARLLMIGFFAVIALVLGFLFQGDVARAWAGEIRRIVKLDAAAKLD